MKSEKKINNLPTGQQSLAELLKETRQNKNISLEKLSELTKIQIYHLEAIESGQFEKLPPLVYRDGILKRLAKFLEIDKNKILKIYKDENPSIDPTLKLNGGVDLSYVSEPLLPKKNFYFILTPKKLTLFLGGLFFVLISLYLWYQFNFLISPPTLVIEPKEDIITKNELVSINGRTDNRVDLTINGENVYIASNGSFSKNVQLAIGLNVIEVKAINNFGKITKIIRQIFREQ